MTTVLGLNDQFLIYTSDNRNEIYWILNFACNEKKKKELFMILTHFSSVSHFYTPFLYPISIPPFYTPFLSPLSIPHFYTLFLYPLSISSFYTPFLYPLSIPHFYTPFLYPLSIPHFYTLFLYPISIPPFYTPFPYPITIPHFYNLRFSDVFRGYRNVTLDWVNWVEFFSSSTVFSMSKSLN